jgi:hypothetical protein
MDEEWEEASDSDGKYSDDSEGIVFDEEGEEGVEEDNDEDGYDSDSIDPEPTFCCPIICHSGGALGADTCWAANCMTRKIQVIHWTDKSSFSQGSVVYRTIPNYVLDEGEEKLFAANETLRRSVQKYARFLAKNWPQVKYAEQIFAVGDLIAPGEKGEKGFANRCRYSMVDGGTAYAVQMGIMEGREVFLFDQKDGQWKKFDNKEEVWNVVHKPKIEADFAGIGTSNLTRSGKKAIQQIIQRSFPIRVSKS